MNYQQEYLPQDQQTLLHDLLNDPDFILFRTAVASELTKAEIDLVRTGIWVEPGTAEEARHKLLIDKAKEFTSVLKVIDSMTKSKYRFFSLIVTT